MSKAFVKLSDSSNLAELIGLGAIVISLIFVGFEIRQNQNVARSELGSETFVMVQTIEHLKATPEMAAAFAKMLDDPDNMTIAEMTQIDGLLYSVGSLLQREWYLVEREIFPENDNARRDLIPFYFGSPYAQSWWRANKTRFHPQFGVLFGDEIEATPQTATRNFLERRTGR